MSEYIPILNSNLISYIRKEHEGNYTFRLKTGPDTGTQLMNSTAMEVVEFCQQKRPVSELYRHFEKKYFDVNPSQLENDVSDILKKFTHLGLIRWKDGLYPFKDQISGEKNTINSQYHISVYIEEYFPKINKFLNAFRLPGDKSELAKRDGNFVYISPFTTGSSFEKFHIGSEGSASRQTMFMLLDDQGEIVAIIKFVFPVKTKFVMQCSVASVSSFIFKDQRNLELLPSILAYCEKEIRKVHCGDEAVTKIRLAFTGSSLKENKQLIDILLNCGYERECVLEKEIEQDEVHFIAKSL